MNRIKEIKERLENTTGNEWFYEEDEYSWDLYGSQGDYMIPLKIIKAPKKSKEYAEYYPDRADAEFIVNAKDDIQFLLAEVERLQDELKKQK